MEADVGTAKMKPSRPRRRLMPTVGLVLFATGFLVALGLLVLGGLFATSASQDRSQLAFSILGLNLAVIVVLAAYLSVRVWSVIAGRTGQAAPLLHRRFVLIFSFVALLPAILVGAFSTTLITQDIEDVAGERLRQNMAQTQEFLNSYVRKELQTLFPKAQFVRQLLEQDGNLIENRVTLTALLQRVALDRDLDSIYIVNTSGLVLARVESASTPKLRIPNPNAFGLLSRSQTAFQSRPEHDYLIALSRVDAVEDTYVYVGDFLSENAGVLSSISDIEEHVGRLEEFGASSKMLNRTFVLTFVEAAMLMLMLAVIIGSVLANRIIDPIANLISASERVRDGDLTARVGVDRNWGEISDLGGAFNRMTEQLAGQRADLVREHDISEERRIFTEAVLSGVTAGVIGLGEGGRVKVTNRSALELVGKTREDLTGKPISLCLPEFENVFRKARESISRQADDQVEAVVNGEDKIFDTRVTAYTSDGTGTGWVVTFDDMTRLVAAQRNSAWREVAKRIAHEIKNPLTPIQLSAERLQLKFSSSLDADTEEQRTLASCTDTILRAVGNLERMVDEFSSYARMPEPLFEPTHLQGILESAAAEQSVAFPTIQIRVDASGKTPVLADARLLNQAITNLVKNAGEAVTGAIEAGSLRTGKGEITLGVEPKRDTVVISVEDNGPGWPELGRDRLLEPYVTTRDGGTGLGLAIVKRIAEDHGGRLQLGPSRSNPTGARATIELPHFLSREDAA